jgi:ferredoxin-NADP reductase
VIGRGAVRTQPAAATRPDLRPPRPHPEWQAATVTQVRLETPTARTLVLQVPGWAGHDAGQHAELRLRRPDGSLAVRPYSIASASRPGGFDLTIDHHPADPAPLAQALQAGAVTQVRGPAGDRIVWRPDQPEPIQLIAGGSGVVPLMAILRAHAQAGSQAPLRLLYSVRRPESVIYRAELEWRDNPAAHVSVTYAYSRAAPQGASRPPRRIGGGLAARATWPPGLAPTCYIAGPAAFVDTITGLLIAAGHRPSRLRTESFTAARPARPAGVDPMEVSGPR